LFLLMDIFWEWIGYWRIWKLFWRRPVYVFEWLVWFLAYDC
jgi:hypothetical protein